MGRLRFSDGKQFQFFEEPLSGWEDRFSDGQQFMFLKNRFLDGKTAFLMENSSCFLKNRFLDGKNAFFPWMEGTPCHVLREGPQQHGWFFPTVRVAFRSWHTPLLGVSVFREAPTGGGVPIPKKGQQQREGVEQSLLHFFGLKPIGTMGSTCDRFDRQGGRNGRTPEKPSSPMWFP